MAAACSPAYRSGSESAAELRRVALSPTVITVEATLNEDRHPERAQSGPAVVRGLVRGIYPTSLRLIVALETPDARAQDAGAAATRLDYNEAPQREIVRVNKMMDDGRAAGENSPRREQAAVQAVNAT